MGVVVFVLVPAGTVLVFQKGIGVKKKKVMSNLVMLSPPPPPFFFRYDVCMNLSGLTYRLSE